MFLLALCAKGAENALVAEASRLGFSRAYSRQGLVTLKTDAHLDVDTLPSLVFARHIGVSVDVAAAKQGARLVHTVGQPGVVPRLGDLVATVVDEKWASLHRHAVGRSPFPGGTIDVAVPAEAPSRALLKIEEAIVTFALDIHAGQHAIELGSAPGGASFNLLQRGLEVVGIDPNDMDRRVLAHARFTHVKRTSNGVDAGAFADPDWVLLDVNVPPGTALRGAMPFLERARRGAVLTLKMKDWSLADEVDGWLRRVKKLPFAWTARQLSSNAQEICVVGTAATVHGKGSP